MQELREGAYGLKAWPVLGIAFIQCTFLLDNWFLYHAWVAFCGHPAAAADLALRAVLLVLACSFVVAALLSFYSANLLVKAIYRLAAVWMGFLNFLLWGACLSWLSWWVLS